MSSTFNIKSTLNSLYPTIILDKESETFLNMFLDTYGEKILELSSTNSLVDMQQAFAKLTPKKIRTISLFKTGSKSKMKNGKKFIKAVTESLANILINKIVQCTIKYKQKKLYPSCIIIAIANDKELTKLSNKLGFLIPSKKTNYNDSRTNKELRSSLRPKFKGISNFTREDLLFLSQPYVDEVDISESKLIKFYINKYNANDKKNYSFNDIVKKWDDYKLETKHDFIQWLFPDETGGVNPKAPNLTNNDIEIFKTNSTIRSNVVSASLRMLLFYGFVLDNKDIVKQIKPLNRRDKGRTIGLFSTHNYKRLTRIMKFLNIINMEFVSSVFYLALCRAMRSNRTFLKKVLENKSLKIWMSTQNLLRSYVDDYDIKKLYNNPSSEETDEWILIESPEYKEESKICSISGMDYTGNSCYMDSVLICTFAIPNKTITDNILKKNLSSLKNINRQLWSRCNDDIDIDIKRRQSIQKTLNDITYSMRGKKTVKNCSNLRSLIKNCPGSQAFHETLTQDAGEFLSYLFNLFQVDVATTKRQTYGSNSLGVNPDWKLVTTKTDNYASPIIDIISTKLQNIEKGYNITKAVKQSEDALLPPTDIWTPNKAQPDVTYIRRKEVFRMKSSPLIIFNVIRTYGEAIFDKPKTKKEKESGRGMFKGIATKNIFKELTAPETMELKNKTLHLTAIVVHTGGAHYVANFKCGGKWYWYNDNPGGSKHTINYTGSYEQMLKTNPNPLSHGTLFFYM